MSILRDVTERLEKTKRYKQHVREDDEEATL